MRRVCRLGTARAFIALLVWVGFASAHDAGAATRVALVIGNSDYRDAPRLRNAVNDAEAITERLTGLGFEVLDGTDLEYAAMRRLIREFSDAVAGAELGLFFYAGHGIQVNGKNYLLPIDAALKSEADLDFAAIDVDLVTRQLDRGSATKVLLLDACRDNPFESALTRSMALTRTSSSLGRGLAKIRASGGSLIAFATEPGEVALDGDGVNSPFTTALLKHIGTPGLEINVMMTRVRAEVFKSTDRQQLPWTNSSLIGEVYLMPVIQGDLNVTVAPGAQTAEVLLWQAAEKGGTAAEYEAYLDQFPEGTFAGLAKVRIAALTNGDGAEQTASEPAAETNKEQPEVVAALGPAEVEAAIGLTRSARREIQERLSVLGHDPRGIDGVFGPGTRAAISAWQGTAALPQNGYLTQDQIARVKAQSETGLAAYRAEQVRKREEARKREETRKEAARRQQSTSDPGNTSSAGAGSNTSSKTTGPWRAVAACGNARGTASHTNRQRAMLQAAKACAARGGSPTCCTTGVTVSR